MNVNKILVKTIAPLALCMSSFIFYSPVALADAERDAASAYQAAKQSINGGQFKLALQQLRLLQRQFPAFSNIAGVKTRISVLHEADLAGGELATFLNALDARDVGDSDNALRLLRNLVIDQPNSPLMDDAIYLMAYVHLMERFEFDTARAHLAELKLKDPDTAYLDAAEYLGAIALEQSGQTAQAVIQFEALRDKHTSVSLPFGYRIARGNVMSRYWFDRADRRLKLLAEQRDRSSTLASRNQVSDGTLNLSVLVSGAEVDLLLKPSRLTGSAQWRDAQLRDQLPPALGVFSGHIKGDTNSWARVVISDNDIHGVVMMNGEEHRLHTEDLIGTLDYYQPKHRAGTPIRLGGSQQELPMLLDTLPPPPMPPIPQKRSTKKGVGGGNTDMQVVPMSIVIDSQYNRYYNGEALLHAINSLNVADAVYRPIGYTLQIDEAVVIAETDNDPMAIGPTTLESMLRNFRTYRQSKSTLFSDSAFVYLFTGNAKTDITLGLAWIDTACRIDGYDVGVTTPSSFSEVLLTHELGHSLGAQHDTDTECSTTRGKLMSPRISGSTDTDMTQCSQTSIVGSKNRACFIDALDLSLNLRQTGSSVAIDVRNLDSGQSASAQLVIEVDREASVTWPAECELMGPGGAECQLPFVPPQGMTTLNLPFTSAATPKLSAQVISVDAPDPTPSNNVVALNLSVTDTDFQLHSINGVNKGDIVAGLGSTPTAVTQPSAASGGGAVSWVWLAGLVAALLGSGSAADRSNQSSWLSASNRL